MEAGPARLDSSGGPKPAFTLKPSNHRKAKLIPLVDVQRDVVDDPMTGANVWQQARSLLTQKKPAGSPRRFRSLDGAQAFEIELLWKQRALSIPGSKIRDFRHIALAH